MILLKFITQRVLYSLDIVQNLGTIKIHSLPGQGHQTPNTRHRTIRTELISCLSGLSNPDGGNTKLMVCHCTLEIIQRNNNTKGRFRRGSSCMAKTMGSYDDVIITVRLTRALLAGRRKHQTHGTTESCKVQLNNIPYRGVNFFSANTSISN